MEWVGKLRPRERKGFSRSHGGRAMTTDKGKGLLPPLGGGLQSVEEQDRGRGVGPLNPKLHLCLEGSLGEYKRGV